MMMMKHKGKVVAIEFTPKYRKGESQSTRIMSLMKDAENKKQAVKKSNPEIQIKGTRFVLPKSGSMPVMKTHNEILDMQDANKGEVTVGLATTEWGVEEVKSNPSEAVASAIVDAGMDQREDMLTTLGKIIPETTQLELANMMSSRGKRAAIDLTMAKMSSGTEPLRAIPSPVAKILTGPNNQPVSREKIAYQALGIKPPRSAQVDSRFKASLRKRISEILGIAGTVKDRKGKTLNLGQFPFIDNHIFLTRTHINDFREMIALYHLVRERNAPFIELMVPGFQRDDENEVPLDKMIDYLMPSPDHLFRGERLMFFSAKEARAPKKLDFFKKYLLGLRQSTSRLQRLRSNQATARSMLKAYQSKAPQMFLKTRTAVSVLAESPLTLRFDEDTGALPEPEDAQTEENRDWWMLDEKEVSEKMENPTTYSVTGVYFGAPNKKPEKIRIKPKDLFISPAQHEYLSAYGKSKVAEIPKNLQQKSVKGKPTLGTQMLLPLHNRGFTLPPIGWNRGWMIPTMQVIDEYWSMLGANENVQLEVHDLLYLIGNQAMESMGYEINAQEYLIILLLLGVFDSTGKSRTDQAIGLTLSHLSEKDGALSKFLTKLEELKGSAVEVQEMSDAIDEDAANELEIEKEELERIEDYLAGYGRLFTTLTPYDPERKVLKRRKVARPPSILPFLAKDKQGEVSTKYWEKAKIKALTESQKKKIEAAMTAQLATGEESIDTIKDVFDDVVKTLAAAKSAFRLAEETDEKGNLRKLGALNLLLLTTKLTLKKTKEKLEGATVSMSSKVIEDTAKLETAVKSFTTILTRYSKNKNLAPEIETIARVLKDYLQHFVDTLPEEQSNQAQALIDEIDKIKAIEVEAEETITASAEKAQTEKAYQGLEELVGSIDSMKSGTASSAFKILKKWMEKYSKQTNGKVPNKLKAAIKKSADISDDPDIMGTIVDESLRDIIVTAANRIITNPETYYTKQGDRLAAKAAGAIQAIIDFDKKTPDEAKETVAPLISKESPGEKAPAIDDESQKSEPTYNTVEKEFLLEALEKANQEVVLEDMPLNETLYPELLTIHFPNLILPDKERYKGLDQMRPKFQLLTYSDIGDALKPEFKPAYATNDDLVQMSSKGEILFLAAIAEPDGTNIIALIEHGDGGTLIDPKSILVENWSEEIGQLTYEEEEEEEELVELSRRSVKSSHPEAIPESIHRDLLAAGLVRVPYDYYSRGEQMYQPADSVGAEEVVYVLDGYLDTIRRQTANFKRTDFPMFCASDEGFRIIGTSFHGGGPEGTYERMTQEFGEEYLRNLGWGEFEDVGPDNLDIIHDSWVEEKPGWELELLPGGLSKMQTAVAAYKDAVELFLKYDYYHYTDLPSGERIERDNIDEFMKKKGVSRRRPNPPNKRMYKGVQIKKLKKGYRVKKKSGNMDFKLLKQAKEYIDSMKDQRRSKVLEGHTCIYMVQKSPCGGLLYTMKQNPHMHKCKDCGAKYRLEAD
tara:strand:- start:2691 stop:7130 length:4440 start_codon:yes stop_codon:yes gene_type:complete